MPICNHTGSETEGQSSDAFTGIWQNNFMSHNKKRFCLKKIFLKAGLTVWNAVKIQFLPGCITAASPTDLVSYPTFSTRDTAAPLAFFMSLQSTEASTLWLLNSLFSLPGMFSPSSMSGWLLLLQPTPQRSFPPFFERVSEWMGTATLIKENRKQSWDAECTRKSNYRQESIK